MTPCPFQLILPLSSTPMSIPFSSPPFSPLLTCVCSCPPQALAVAATVQTTYKW